MSYTRKERQSIVVEGVAQDTIFYPSSNTGGSKVVRIPYSKTVILEIHIHVDTVPFDKSIKEANEEVKLLTGSVVATEAAQIVSKMVSAENISHTVVDGFYGLIKSEIRQQILEIRPKVEALLVELVQHQEAALAKQQQFYGDFQRIAERYSKIFHELDKELRNRVMRLNEAAVGVLSTLSACAGRASGHANPGEAAVHHRETGQLQAILLSGGLKFRASAMLGSSGKYLDAEGLNKQQFEDVLHQARLDGLVEHAVPVLYWEGSRSSAAAFRECILPERHGRLYQQKDRLAVMLSGESLSWPTMGAYTLRALNDRMERDLEEARRTKVVSSDAVEAWIRKLMERNAEIKSNL